MNNIFSLNRTLKIIRKDMFSEYKSLLIWLYSAAGVVIVISALNVLISKLQGSLSYNSSMFHTIFYIIYLFAGGFILTSTMFKDVHDKSRNIYWLMLPGSTFEKMISRLLISSVLYVLLLTLIYPVLAAVSELFNLLLFGMRQEFFNPFQADLLQLIPYYLVVQSIFFAGAAGFRKHPLAKTIFSLALFQIILSLVSALFVRIVFADYIGSMISLEFSNADLVNFYGFSTESLTGFARFIWTAAKVIFWGLLAPFFYVLSYFKLAEKEVHHGI